WPSTRSWSSTVPFISRNMPPTIRIRSRCEKANGPTKSQGSVSVTNHDMTESNTRRMSSASDSPTTRARSRSRGGSFSTRMAMKIRLSIPRTISNNTSVSNPAHADGSAIHSNIMTGSAVQVTQHLGENFGRCRHHPPRFHPELFPVEVRDQTTRLENKQTARCEIPWFESHSAEAVDTPCSHIGQREHSTAQTTYCGTLFQHVGEGRITVHGRITQMSGQQGIMITALATDADAPVIQKCTTAPAGREQFVAGRIVNHRLSNLAAMHQRDRNGI